MSKKGTIIGLRNLVVAEVIEDSAAGTTYGTVKHVAGAISANVNPNSSMETLFADDGPWDTATSTGQITVGLNVADLDLPTQAFLFGHTMEGGILKRRSGDTPPWVAVGFKSLKSNGRYRYTWLAKGKFGLPEQNNTTKGDTPEFQTPTTEGSFVRRESDDEWERHIDEDDADFIPSLATQWFNGPFGGASDVVAPTILTSVPANNATGVAPSAVVTWTFSKGLALSTVTTGNFMLVKDSDGAAVAGTLSLNAERKVVTFTPAANLTAGAYRAIATAGVSDVSGNKLATASITKFTVA